MSRIGRRPISVPKGVEIKIDDGNLVTVKGPKGQLQQQLPAEIIIAQENGTVNVQRPSEAKQHKSLHGLTRTLLFNMVHGVTEGWERRLEINGVGYRAALEGKTLVLLASGTDRAPRTCLVCHRGAPECQRTVTALYSRHQQAGCRRAGSQDSRVAPA